MKNKLTVIVTNYNGENFLEKCLDSLNNQIYKLFEVIIIDDCSNDNSIELIEKYSKNYICTIIKNIKNIGAGASRNRALKNVKTDYVTFLDSDDYLPNDYYEKLMNKIASEKADICVTDIKLIYEDGTPSVLCTGCNGKFSKKNIIDNGLAASPCNKIFALKLLQKFKFAENIMNEDIPMTLSCLINSNNIVYENTTYYNYVQHINSIQHSKLNEKRLDIFKAINILFNSIDCKEYQDIIIYNQIITFLFYVIPCENSFWQRFKFLKKYNYEAKKFIKNSNSCFDAFLKTQSKLHKLYYKLLYFLTLYRFSIIENIVVSFYKFYKKHFTKNVLRKSYDISDLINLAKKNKKKIDISVIIPNYNYEQFLIQRLYSILNQKYIVGEILILDDCSKDNSDRLISEIVNKLEKYISIRYIKNSENSGSAFKQWRKGIENTNCKYIWICEADDYCNNSFLKKLVPTVLANDKISVAYCDTAFINKNGYMIKRSVASDIDLQNTGHWNKSFINNGIKEINDYAFLNCTIANVSSIIFKRNDFSKVFNKMDSFKQAGDWLFYLELMEKGDIFYYNKSLNYYRVHGENATTINKKQLHFDEIKRIHKELSAKINFTSKQKELINERYLFLQDVWGIDIRKDNI